MTAKTARSRAEPFGQLQQRELEYMRLLGFDASDRLLFAVLKVRYDARLRAVADRISTLSDWTGLSERKVQYSLRSLADRNLIARERHRVTGGPQGYVWSWTTTVRAYEDWPSEPLTKLASSAIACSVCG